MVQVLVAKRDRRLGYAEPPYPVLADRLKDRSTKETFSYNITLKCTILPTRTLTHYLLDPLAGAGFDVLTNLDTLITLVKSAHMESMK